MLVNRHVTARVYFKSMYIESYLFRPISPESVKPQISNSCLIVAIHELVKNAVYGDNFDIFGVVDLNTNLLVIFFFLVKLIERYNLVLI